MPSPSVLGGASEASIDQVNIWMRSTPWYQAQMKAWGQDPGHPTLSDWQSNQILRMAQANGVVVDEGNIELDDHGNFNPIGHKLRNTLLVGGIAAATIATMGAAGVFAGAGGAAAGGAGAAGGGALASTITVPTVGGLAAGGTGLAAGAGTAAAAGGAGSAAVAGLSYGDLVKYGLPVAGNLVGGVIQAKATGAASDAQQRYLEEALAYQKEQDAYARTTDASRYADKQRIDAAAVQYGKDSDEYARAVAAAAVKKEQTRYGDYQGRIAPFIANGVSSNDRMATLLGLPARAASAWGDGTRGAPGGPDAPGPAPVFLDRSGGATGTPRGTGPAFDPTYIGQQLDAEYAKHGLTATGPGTGPTDKAYFIKAVMGTKEGWDPGYWSPRITEELRKAGIADRPVTARPPAYSSAPPAPAPAGPSASSFLPGDTYEPPAGSPPAAAAASPASVAPGAPVQMRGPDGSVKAVPADQVDHYKSLGATVMGAAA